MKLPAAISVAPTRHDDRTRNDSGAGFLGPTNRLQKALGAIRLPGREQELRFRGQRMQNLGAEDAVLAVLGLEVVVVPEAMRIHVSRQGLTKMISVASKAGIENGDLDSLAAVTQRSPAIHS